MKLNKLFAVLAGVSMLATQLIPAGAFAATYSEELQGAYNWAYSKNITTMSSIDNANMYGAVTRAELAKMLANYAKTVLGLTPDTSASCTFTDTASVQGDLATAVVEACQLGIMGQNVTAFRPYDTITRAEFGTALSRLLWGSKYEGGTPYYANHLNALKAANIMTNIANAESTKEVRGYVMLMLQRSESVAEPTDECEDALVKIACSLGSDECPAACQEEPEPDDPEVVVVKSGDLVVTAEAAANRKVLKGGISDLDTLTFKTSEEVEITKVTLERYGYSSASNISGVRLEDEDGNVIAESKSLTKDKVTLSIKKDYRIVDGTLNATVVVETTSFDEGSTLGFKVTDVTSTAENLNLKNYDAYTYDIVNYTSDTVYVSIKGTSKNYNYEEGNSYEIARLRVDAGANDILVKGFTLTNAGKLDMGEFLDELVVKADSEEIDAKYSVNKDDELVVSFDEVEVAANKKVTFILEADFADFDDYGESVAYYVAESADINAIEKKNDTRVSLNIANAAKASAKTYTFNGGKIKLSNTKLGNVDAAQASEGTVIAEGNVEITEPLSKVSFSILANANARFIDTLTFVVNGEEYEGTVASDFAFTSTYNNVTYTGRATYLTGEKNGCAAMKVTENEVSTWVGNTYYVKTSETDSYQLYSDNTCSTQVSGVKVKPTLEFSFKNISIEKSGKVQFKADIKDDENAANKVINFVSSFNRDAFDGAKYDETNKYVSTSDVNGSITFSKVTVQAAKAALENSLTKSVEFLTNETNKKVVFDGTYTAKKGDVYLNTVTISQNSVTIEEGNKVTFYVTIDDTEVTVENLGEAETFSDVLVKAGEKINVKVEAEVEAYGTTQTLPEFTLVLEGEDVNGNEHTGKGSDTLVEMKTKDSGTISISTAAVKNTALLKKANAVFAEFEVKPSNSTDEDLYIDTLELTFTPTTVNSGYIRVKINGVEVDADTDNGAGVITYTPNELIGSSSTIEVIFKDAVIGAYEMTAKVNGKAKEFNRYYAPALVYVTSQSDEDSYTDFKLGVEKYDDDYTIKNIKLYADTTCSSNELDTGISSTKEIEDGEDLEIDNIASSQRISCITYDVYDENNTIIGVSPSVSISRTYYSDYFTVGGDSRRVFAKD